MRWQPTEAVCSECGFDWSSPRDDAVAVVEALAGRFGIALGRVRDPRRRDRDRWSAAMYVWHLVDVLRIGTERLVTLSLDPAAGVACWDENLLAEARRYEQLSPVAGLAVLASTASEWVRIAETAPDGEVTHPVFGILSTADVVRRNAHEACHHLLDIRRAGPFSPDRLALLPAGTGDVAAITELARAAYEPYLARTVRPPAPMTDETNGELAGFVVVRPAGDHLLVDNVAVAPAFQRGGVGRRLLEAAEVRARAAGLSESRLYTNLSMTENLAYYPRHGYRETHRATQAGYERVFFAKHLPEP
ncbi:MAG: GNAT family N-acetyltransferase [Actinomycetota bacterium]|nr:GNAT family N-acetyltransferase [Actinomycetota bacterium]MDA8355134.1 GNAT family N-acetyltransferase [Actinomycetota bacterium]